MFRLTESHRSIQNLVNTGPTDLTCTITIVKGDEEPGWTNCQSYMECCYAFSVSIFCYSINLSNWVDAVVHLLLLKSLMVGLDPQMVLVNTCLAAAK